MILSEMPEKKRHLRLLCLADRLRQQCAKKRALAAGPISSPSTDLGGMEWGEGAKRKERDCTELATVTKLR